MPHTPFSSFNQIGPMQQLLLWFQGEGFQYTQKHIDQLDSNHRMMGARGIRLKVYANGTYEDESIVYFNLQQASRGINDQQQLMARVSRCYFIVVKFKHKYTYCKIASLD